MFNRVFFSIFFLFFVTVSVLLVTNHVGVAIRATNYLFVLLFLYFLITALGKDEN